MYPLSVRDWLWLTALLSMGLAWWADRQSYDASRRRMQAQYRDMQSQTESMRRAVRASEKRFQDLLTVKTQPKFIRRPSRRESPSAE